MGSPIFTGQPTTMETPLFTTEPAILGVLAVCLGLVFWTSTSNNKILKGFYSVVPALLLCYLLPAIATSLGIIAPEWNVGTEAAPIVEKTQVYYMASRYLLPAALVLMTLSIDLKGIFKLGPKALIMFLTGTAGIVIGGPIAILFVSWIYPEALGGTGPDAIWRGLSTIAGSWIGGGANQTAMFEIFEYNESKYGGMILVDIVVANIWMAVVLLGIAKRDAINRWLRADATAIEELKERVSSLVLSRLRTATTADYVKIFSIAFIVVGLSHVVADFVSAGLSDTFEAVRNKKSALSSFGSGFFWLISVATAVGVALSFTPLRKLEDVGASRIGTAFIYILVATIGMKMDLGQIFENPFLIVIGLIWMSIHALLLIGVARWIRAPYFYLAVGSQANVGGAASAPVVAAAFHPALATVGVLLAVLGYAIGTYAAQFCAYLMEIASS